MSSWGIVFQHHTQVNRLKINWLYEVVVFWQSLTMMKAFFRKLCSPVLNIFEKGEGPYAYKPLNRQILIVIGVMFGGLAALVVYLLPMGEDLGFLVPVIVFSVIALISLIVGLLGTDRAVAKIWGNR